MKTLLLLIFSFLTVIVSGQSSKSTTIFKHHKPIMIDLNNDNILDAIFLSSSIQDSSSFNKITVSISGFGNQTFLAKNYWTNVDSEFLIKNKNAISSNKLFLLVSKINSIIILFGNLDGAGYREDFSIINIKDNKPLMVFDRGENDIDVELPLKHTDLDNDGRTDFVFRNYFELYENVDSLEADIGAYSPYLVYTIDNECKLNETLTKKYNDENYVFAGFEYSEKIRILYPRNGGKPSVAK